MTKCLLIMAVIFITGLFPASSCGPRDITQDQVGAVIVDQLSEVRENAVFVNRVSESLYDYGFAGVDTFSGEELGLRFFIDLPQKGYRLVLLRVHSGLISEEEAMRDINWLFTNERYRRTIRFTEERLTGKIAVASVSEDSPSVFAIGPQFITSSMAGAFPGTVVIAMGCHSFTASMAEAFINKGASAYLGWTGLVGLQFTDEMTVKLIEKLCAENMPVKKAVDAVMADVDTESLDTELKYYPLEIGGERISDLIK